MLRSSKAGPKTPDGEGWVESAASEQSLVYSQSQECHPFPLLAG